MLTTSENVRFPDHNHLPTTGTDDPSLNLWHSGDNQSVGSSARAVRRWLYPGNQTFSEVVSMVVTWLPGG